MFSFLLLACKQYKRRSLCWRYGITPTKTKDQNRLCSRTLCSVAREIMKDFYLKALGAQIRFLRVPSRFVPVTKTLIRTWLPDAVCAVVSPAPAKKSIAHIEGSLSAEMTGQISASMCLWAFHQCFRTSQRMRITESNCQRFQKSSSTLCLTCRWKTQAQEMLSAGTIWPQSQNSVFCPQTHAGSTALLLPSGHTDTEVSSAFLNLLQGHIHPQCVDSIFRAWIHKQSLST